MIGILDYGMGNLSSVTNAFNYLGINNNIVRKSDDFAKISHLIIPGVGSFAKAMQNIRERKLEADIIAFCDARNPILGICLGMQLLASLGKEPYDTNGMGMISGVVMPFPEIELRVPHIGWNGINMMNRHPVLENVKESADFYFVHSYYFSAEKSENIIAVTEYGIQFPSIVTNDNGNAIGVQFHPEKSQKQGLQILENFANWVYA